MNGQDWTKPAEQSLTFIFESIFRVPIILDICHNIKHPLNL